MHPLIPLALLGLFLFATSKRSDAGNDNAPSGQGAPSGPRKIAHIGDSLTAYTIPELREAYAARGLDAEIDAFGGRAIFQKLPKDPKTGKQAALDLQAQGPFDLWVVALGTNDTANVAVGSGYTRAQAIDAMMEAIGPGQKVLWVNTFTKMTSGAWHNDNMRLWNQALEDAKARWPNMQVFDWASIASRNNVPFSDGIHHTKAGYAARNEAIANAAAAELVAP